jgi:hypothetical protein
MTQTYQAIGQASPELERVAAERMGRIDATNIQSPVEEITDASDYSFYDDRANYQALGHPGAARGAGYPIANMAGYRQPSMASYAVTPVAVEDNP